MTAAFKVESEGQQLTDPLLKNDIDPKDRRQTSKQSNQLLVNPALLVNQQNSLGKTPKARLPFESMVADRVDLDENRIVLPQRRNSADIIILNEKEKLNPYAIEEKNEQRDTRRKKAQVLQQVLDDANIDQDEQNHRRNRCCEITFAWCYGIKDIANWFKALWHLSDDQL